MSGGGTPGRLWRRSLRRSVGVALLAALIAATSAQAATDVTISDAATSGCVLVVNTYTCSGATGNIQRSALETDLGGGSVTVDASAGVGGGTGSITLNAGSALTWSANTLTLQAGTGNVSSVSPAHGAGLTVNTTGGAVNLGNSLNDFTGIVSVGGATNATVADATALSLGSSQVTGLLHVLAGQGGGTGSHVTQAAASTLNVNGPTTVEVGGPSSDVILDKANLLNGAIGVIGGAKVRDLTLRSTVAGAAPRGPPAPPRHRASTPPPAPAPPPPPPPPPTPTPHARPAGPPARTRPRRRGGGP